MDFAFSDEQEELRRYARQWLDDRSDPATVRRLMATEDGFDRADWKALAEMGWPAMAIPEEYGGAGFGFLELAVLLEEQGAALLCAPFLSTVVMAAELLMRAGSEQQKQEWLPAIAAGEVTATVAWTEPNGRWDESAIETTATRDGGDYLLSGVKRYVLDGATADLVVVAARTDAGITSFLVPAGHPGVRVESLPTMDETRKQAQLTFDSVRVPAAAILGEDGGGWAPLEQVIDVASVALALEQAGGARRCLDMAVAYAKERVQFNRPIGSFQAIKHMCAEMLVQVEAASAAAHYAAWAVAESPEELDRVVPLAKSYCSEAYTHCAGQNIQIHGGIGFTWEHDAHLYFKRAKSSELMFGDPTYHRRRLSTRLGL